MNIWLFLSIQIAQQITQIRRFPRPFNLKRLPFAMRTRPLSGRDMWNVKKACEVHPNTCSKLINYQQVVHYFPASW